MWTEADSATYLALADVAVPRRRAMMAALIALAPFGPDEAPRIVELGSGDGRLAAALLDCYPRATLVAFDGSEAMRTATAARTSCFGERARVRPFDLAALDWWDVMFGADLVVSSLALHHLNDAKKQYLYKAAAERLSSRGALLVADLVAPAHEAARRAAADAWDAVAREQADEAGAPALFARFVDEGWNHFRFPDEDDRPSALFHHLVWLRHAGFAAVDCAWLQAGHAVYGGFKQADGAAGVPRDQALRAAFSV